MRRLLLTLGVVLLAGCDKARDLFSAHAEVAAEAAGQRLTAERLAEVLTSGKAIQANRPSAEFVANMWIDYTLFAQAVAQGMALDDSATIAQVAWPEIAETKAGRWHDTLVARRVKLTPAAADSAYGGDSLRVFQHILFRVAPTADPETRAAARRRAEATLGRVRGGADFGRLAEELTQDPSGKGDRGFLPPSPRGAFVTSFDSAGWTLAPGAVSGVVETPFGYHIIRRPPAAEVRDRLLGYLQQRTGARLDSIYMDSLGAARRLSIKSSAPAAIRAALGDPERAARSDKALATYRGGEFTVGEFMQWVRALPPQFAQQIQQAPDSELVRFTRVVAQNTLLLEEADSAGIRLSPVEWETLRRRYLADIDSLRGDLGLGADFRDSSMAKGERQQVAALKVDQYFDRLVGLKARARPLPGGQAGPGSGLGGVLRSRLGYKIYPAGLERAVELAKAKTPSPTPPGGPGMQPAPGAPPIPGAGAGSDTPGADSARQGARTP
ncbi:MAG TPA: peptidylprolyl isomerase [Gemmatimonadales bacterium]|nr:peptidylprolyl isomerase [Gemmatimonadales bacterium]